jgi:hypothetical protein
MNMKKKKKICIVTYFHCLRNVKLAIAAWMLGYELELITQANGYGLISELGFLHIYKSIKIWETPSQLEAYMRDSTADVFWCHNEPDVMAELAVKPHIKKDRIIIHDCHDLPTLHPGRGKEFAPQEKAACEGADFIFVPTKNYIDLIEKKYGKGKNVHVVYSCSPSIFFPDCDLPRVNGMLYCGQVNVPSMNSQLPYRNCLPLFQYLTQLGVATHIYHTTPTANLQPYMQVGACIYGTLRMFAANLQYTRYDYAFVGSNVECEEIQICMPNKLFDCMAAGLPLICLNATTAGEFVKEKGIGVSIQGLINMSTVDWGNVDMWEGMREKVREIRYEYTAEKEVEKVFEKVGI